MFVSLTHKDAFILSYLLAQFPAVKKKISPAKNNKYRSTERDTTCLVRRSVDLYTEKIIFSF